MLDKYEETDTKFTWRTVLALIPVKKKKQNRILFLDRMYVVP